MPKVCGMEGWQGHNQFMDRMDDLPNNAWPLWLAFQKSAGKFQHRKNESSKAYPYPRRLAGLNIVELGALNGPVLPQNPVEKVGGFAPHLFHLALR